MAPTKRTAAPDVEGYFERLPPESRAALTKLRKTIRSVVPGATERLSYQIPTFEHGGPLVAYAAFKDHFGFYVMSPRLMAQHAEELKDYLFGKATLRFTTDHPLPTALVKKFVKLRVAENEARVRA